MVWQRKVDLLSNRRRKVRPALFNFSPNQCQITLTFDKEEKLSDYSYSGC